MLNDFLPLQALLQPRMGEMFIENQSSIPTGRCAMQIARSIMVAAAEYN
jgi:hypothetical protein